jgi:hypothetical protein
MKNLLKKQATEKVVVFRKTSYFREYYVDWNGYARLLREMRDR